MKRHIKRQTDRQKTTKKRETKGEDGKTKIRQPPAASLFISPSGHGKQLPEVRLPLRILDADLHLNNHKHKGDLCSMDIQYLLWLQELRNATGGVFDEFFNALSKFAVDIMPLLPFVAFWLEASWTGIT